MTDTPHSTDAPGPKKLLRVIYKFLILSLIVHAVGLLIFGGFVIIKKMQPEEVTFTAPPATVRVEPPKRQYKLRVKQQKQRSSRPALQKRLQSTRVSSVSLPDVKTKIEPIKQKSAKIPGVSSGLGEGLSLGGGMGGGMIFGVNIKARNLGVLLDVSYSTHSTLHVAVTEIQHSFPEAIIVLVPGCGMQKQYSKGKVYKAGDFVEHMDKYKNNSTFEITSFVTKLLRTNSEFETLFEDTDRNGNLYVLHIDSRVPKGLILGTHMAFKFLIDQGVDGIYWFADFMDHIDEELSQKVIRDLQRRKIPVYLQVLESEKQPNPLALEFSTKTGGDIIRSH